MARLIRSAAVALCLIAGIAACAGGAGNPTQDAGPTAAGGATTAPAGTDASTGGPPATDAPVPTTSGAGIAASACELLTVEEAAGELGTGPLTAAPGALGGQTFCDYRTASGEAVLTSYMQPGASQLWDVWESSLETDPVIGLGDKAMYEPSTKLLFVLKGDTFFNVFVADVSLDAAAALEKEKALAEIMVARI